MSRTGTAAKKANKDIVDFLTQKTQKSNSSRRDSATLSRAGAPDANENVNRRNTFVDDSDFGDLGIPTADRKAGANNYGARKRMPMSAADKKDKIIEFERENNALKEKENFLRQEILMMTTKLRRVEGLIKSRGRAAVGDSDYDITDM